ncbi:dienelactone hydrolase family protein [Apiospora kogelbergensis]|uniref:Dienelactone hydrolase family protein n=1 Tax=Apiospora kogelbergensis TaxID=1337665 RepID=A0AAW0R372_9PEZI
MHYPSFTFVLWGLAAVATGGECCKAKAKCPVASVSDLVNTGNPVGKSEVYENVTMYYTGGDNATDVSVLFLTDIYGLASPENKLLADSFGRAGYFTVAPDLFNGSPSPLDMNAPGFNQTRFLDSHGPPETDPIVAKAVQYLREVRGARRVAVAGYCFGGRYALRFAGTTAGAGRNGVHAAFAAHPSGWTADEIAAVALPASVALGDLDELNPPDKRHELEALLANTTAPWQADLYSGAPHGFAVRANVSEPQPRFAKETAFIQAVRWFEFWAKGEPYR